MWTNPNWTMSSRSWCPWWNATLTMTWPRYPAMDVGDTLTPAVDPESGTWSSLGRVWAKCPWNKHDGSLISLSWPSCWIWRQAMLGPIESNWPAESWNATRVWQWLFLKCLPQDCSPAILVGLIELTVCTWISSPSPLFALKAITLSNDSILYSRGSFGTLLSDAGWSPSSGSKQQYPSWPRKPSGLVAPSRTGVTETSRLFWCPRTTTRQPHG